VDDSHDALRRYERARADVAGMDRTIERFDLAGHTGTGTPLSYDELTDVEELLRAQSKTYRALADAAGDLADAMADDQE
jgi:hypothetical protein